MRQPQAAAPQPRWGELAPAAARRRGCWAMPWQVRFARGRPPGEEAQSVRVTRSAFMSQFPMSPEHASFDKRRHGTLVDSGMSKSSQEYWAKRRAALIDAGVRATTSGQLASAAAVRRRNRCAAVQHASRSARSASPRSGGPSRRVDGARREKRQIERMVSPFSPRGPVKRPTTAQQRQRVTVVTNPAPPPRPSTAPESKGARRQLRVRIPHSGGAGAPGTAPSAVAHAERRRSSSARAARSVPRGGGAEPRINKLNVFRGETRASPALPQPLFLPLTPVGRQRPSKPIEEAMEAAAARPAVRQRQRRVPCGADLRCYHHGSRGREGRTFIAT